MLAKYLSYLFPIPVVKRKSTLSKSLEVTWNKGQLVLDSAQTNYSFGSLQRILRKGLKYIGFERIRNFQEVLVLGVAGGSVIATLVEEIRFQGKVTGVELDAEVLQVAKDYFQIDRFAQLELIVEDAFSFILRSQNQYDLIIIDIFQDTQMPAFLFEDFFMHHINKCLRVNGFILFNTMVLTPEDAQRNVRYRQKFSENYSVRMYPKVEEHNELFTIKKLA